MAEERKKHQLFLKFVENLSISNIFAMWIAAVVMFGFVYYSSSALSEGPNYLVSIDGNRITGFVDAVFFSFAAATSVEPNDITLQGKELRAISIIEVIFSLIMAALITSKLVSLKQEKLLEKISGLGYSEKLNKLITGFSFLTGELNVALNSIKEDKFDRKERFRVRMNLESLRKNLSEIKKEFFENKFLAKNIDQLEIEYILMGLLQVFEKINENLIEMKNKNIKAKGTVIEGFYITSNLGLEVLSTIKKNYPLNTQKAAEIESLIRQMKPKIMNFEMLHEKELELVNPDVIMQRAHTP